VKSESIRFVRYKGDLNWLPLYEEKELKSEIQVITAKVDNFQRGGEKPEFEFIARIPILFQLLPKLASDPRFESYQNRPLPYENHKSVVGRLINSLSSITVVDPKPDLIRRTGYVPMEVKAMDREGRNLSGVLFNLFQNESTKARIEDLLRGLPEHEISKIDFVKTPRNEVQLAIKEKFLGSPTDVPFEALSDGTIRLLAVLATAFSLREGGLMVIEEVDTSLHPSKVERLLDLLMEVAVENKTRLLVTTHNPALLDAIKPNNYNSVVICYRTADKGLSRFVRLVDVPDIESVLLRENLGTVMSKRIYDKYVKRSIDERKKHKDQIIIEWSKRLEVE